MEKLPEKKVLGIIAIIIGIISLVLSWIPIINNFAAVLAVVGAILGIVSLLVNRKHKKTLAWLGTIFSIIAFSIVMVTQSMYSNAIDDATGKNGSQVEKIDKSSSNKKSEISTSSTEKNETFKIGDSVTQKNGMTTVANSVKYIDMQDGSNNQAVVINITLTNNGKKSLDYDEFDYKLDDNGKLTDVVAYAGTDDDGNDLVTDELGSGTLRPGSSVSGSIVGEGLSTDKLKLVSTAYDDTVNWEINLN